jgi:hypothetical protein
MNLYLHDVGTVEAKHGTKIPIELVMKFRQISAVLWQRVQESNQSTFRL